MLFLRSIRPTSIIMLAIPVSVIGTFVAISWLGLSVNVISLAGLAFAVGMVVDAAIVVLENIYRLKERGEKLKHACLEGTLQVWQAVMVSALTTRMLTRTRDADCTRSLLLLLTMVMAAHTLISMSSAPLSSALSLLTVLVLLVASLLVSTKKELTRTSVAGTIALLRSP